MLAHDQLILDSTFNGTLYVTINDGLPITIPNEQLIFDESYIATNGLVKRNTDWKNIPIVRYDDLHQNMPRIGGMFFSSAYLMVNHDKDEFTISGVQEKPAEQKLVGIDTANNSVASVSGVAPDVPESSTPPSSSSLKGLSGGAIAGIVIGILAVLAITTAIALLAWRQKRASAAAPYIPGLAASFGSSTVVGTSRAPIVEKYGYSVSELYAGQGPAVSDVVELDGRSRPMEVRGHGAEREYLMGGRR
jgi:hypothetical protein